MSAPFTPCLAFLREVIHPALDRVTAAAIKESSTPATVYRLDLQYAAPVPAPDSVIAKLATPGWPDDPLGHKREARFYAELLPDLDMAQPQVYFAGQEPGSERCLVIMEDVSPGYRFTTPRHIWTMNEIAPILRTYARLHACGPDVLPPSSERGWLVDRHERRVLNQADAIPAMVGELVQLGLWPELPGLGQLYSWLLAQIDLFQDRSVTLLHNDVYPPNAALPNKGHEAMLFDWEMAGWGLAEMDLAYMFLQPFGSDCGLDKTAALNLYWTERETLAGDLPQKEERPLRQFYADALWAFWLVPVAYRMAKEPFPEGSFPRIYWQSMGPVLGKRLRQLSQRWPTVCRGAA